MTKKTLFFILMIAALLVLALDFIGGGLGWSHSEIIIGEQALYGFLTVLLFAGVGWVLRLLIERAPNYYDDLREQPPIIETERSDWMIDDD